MQLYRLQNLDGDWHEFESKALKRENERKEKEARRAAAREAAGHGRDKDKKRSNDGAESHRESKRPHMDSGKQDDASTQASAADISTNASIA
jgi:CTD kinase subunit alpha